MKRDILEGSLATPRGPSCDDLRTATHNTFDALVLKGNGPIAVEFMSYGCAHCRVMEPVLQQVTDMIKSEEKVFRVNTAQDQELTERYQIRSTPTFVMFLDGKEAGRVEGPAPTVSSVLTAVTHPFGS